MIFKKTRVEGAWVIEPKVFKDERGFFSETWNQRDFKELVGIDHNFVQMNHSRSKKDVLRGLHYQIEHPQAKLIWVTKGEVRDAFVDLRKDSPTFGQWDVVNVSGQTRVYVPAGCAHGFVVLSEEADFHYLVSDYRYPEHERSLKWNDPDLNIDWRIFWPIISEKDEKGHYFKDL
jgi:dTDP-4-dehydrorhamnose 3,5-epimerase